jgi:hypothetical protein
MTNHNERLAPDRRAAALHRRAARMEPLHAQPHPAPSRTVAPTLPQMRRNDEQTCMSRMAEAHAEQDTDRDMDMCQWWQQIGQYQPGQDEDKNMKVSDLIESKYLKQSDIPDPVTVTIQSLKKVNVARDDEAPDYRWTVKFSEFDKSMVYNTTNIKRTAKALGDDTEDWLGKQMQLYVDPDIEFGGNIVGGLRVRGLQRKPVAKRKPEDDAFMDEANRKFDDAADDSVPF